MNPMDPEYRRRNTRSLIGPGVLGPLPEDTDFVGAPTVIDLNTDEGRADFELEVALRKHGITDYPPRARNPYGVAPTPRPDGARPIGGPPPGTDLEPAEDGLVPWRFIESPRTVGQPYLVAQAPATPGRGKLIYTSAKPGRHIARRIREACGRPVRVRYAKAVRKTYPTNALGRLIQGAAPIVEVLEEAEFTAYPLRVEFVGQDIIIHFAGRGDLRFTMPMSRVIWIREPDGRC